jgi:membrane associated rhomboid family serine protease
MGIVDEIKLSFKNGSYLTKLIYINIAIWVFVRLVIVGYTLSGSDDPQLLGWLALPASSSLLLSRPWTMITYMFLHREFFHILFNMLWLYWFGKIFLEYHSQQKLLNLYLTGGFFGGLSFMLAYNLIPVFQNAMPQSQLLGASASVFAVVIAIAVYVPNHLIHLIFIGPVKIKWIALVSVLLSVINLSGDNAGGDFTHLGGALWGWTYMSQLMAGRDITGGFDRIASAFFSRFRPRRKLRIKYNSPNPDYDYNRNKASQQREINRILDKIGKSGYDSLNFEEREMLFKMGSKKPEK